MLDQKDLTERIIGLATEMHRKSGPGLLDSIYAACLSAELEQAGIQHLRHAPTPMVYKGLEMPPGFHADMLVAKR